MRITVLALLALPLFAESIGPFQDRRVVSPREKHAFEIKASREFRLTKKGGALLKAGKLDYLPAEFLVLDSRPAVLLLDTYGEAGRKTVLALLKADGSIAWRLKLKDLFRNHEPFLETMSQTIWHRAWWLDENAVILVARGGEAAKVTLDHGQATAFDADDAIESAERAVLRPDGEQAVTALVELGATRALVGLIGHSEVSKKRRKAIEAALVAAKDEILIDELAREFKSAEIDTAEELLKVGVRVNPAKLHRALIQYETTLLKLLQRGSPHIGWLADHFEMVPTSQAVKPLLTALKKHRGDADLAPRIIAALKPCTGRDFGADPAAWLKAYRVR